MRESRQILPYRSILFPAGEACVIRMLLTTPAPMANNMARNKQACARSPSGNIRKSNATRVVPNVCPNNRAVPSIPLAPPLRRVGAEETMVTLFGVWNSPKPIPQRVIRHTIFQLSGMLGKNIE